MDWKQKLTELKKGDKVRIIKPCNPNCWNQNCARMYLNQIGVIMKINNRDDNRNYNVQGPKERCSFTKDQLEKVF